MSRTFATACHTSSFGSPSSGSLKSGSPGTTAVNSGGMLTLMRKAISSYRKVLDHWTGFEPATTGFTVRCPYQLGPPVDDVCGTGRGDRTLKISASLVRRLYQFVHPGSVSFSLVVSPGTSTPTEGTSSPLLHLILPVVAHELVERVAALRTDEPLDLWFTRM